MHAIPLRSIPAIKATLSPVLAAFVIALVCVLFDSCATRLPVGPRPRSSLVDSRWIEIDGRRIHYLEKGGSGGDLVIVHGFAAYSGPFEKIIGHLPSSLHVVAPDLPGHGFSEGLDNEYTMESFVRFLDAFTRAKELDSFCLLGSSMGANIVAHYAVRFPGRVEKLILLSPVGLVGQEKGMARISKRPLLARIVSGFVGRRTVRRVLSWASGGDTVLVTTDLINEYALSISTAKRRSCMRSVIGNVIDGSYLEDVLPRVAWPVLVIAGDRDPLVRPEHLEVFRRLLQQEKVEIFSGGGHLLHQQFPAQIADLVVDFLQVGPGRRVSVPPGSPALSRRR